MNYKVISIDLAKNVFQVCGLDQNHKIQFNKKVSREKLLDTLRQLSADLYVMEACYSSNPWARAIAALGYGDKVKLIPPHQVKPFLVGNKNDRNDAVAIAEAALRPKARFVAIKTLEQQDIQSLDRIRERLVKHRTAVINQLRGLLSEYGVIISKGPRHVKAEIPRILEDAENALTVSARRFIHDLHAEIQQLDERIHTVEQDSLALINTNSNYQLLLSARGIGPVTATSLIASVNDANQFKNGRAMAAWIGLAPKQYSSGDSTTMGGMSKRGNFYLRKLFIHGARAVANWSKNKTDKFSLWIQELFKRMHPCKAIVAIANKIARIAWAILAKQEKYSPELA
jgi:transposase